MGKVVVGQDDALRHMVVALLAGGHALLEGVPGTGKTLMARSLAMATQSSFRRIQFTPDLMPADVLGVSVYNTTNGQFTFRQGPVFADILLADEINRSPAKTQSALLEAMQERQVTVDGTTHAMSGVFTVFATQNPVEFEGTYPLPEAEVDRFMLKVLVGYGQQDLESRILDLPQSSFDRSGQAALGPEAVLDAKVLAELRQTVYQLHVEPAVRQYIATIIRRSRAMPQVSLGASPRAAVMLMQAAKAAAVVDGRDFVTPDDVKTMALPVLRHRLLLHPEFEVEGQSPDSCIEQLLAGLEVPR
jgi:MoxR-like ATPase